METIFKFIAKESDWIGPIIAACLAGIVAFFLGKRSADYSSVHKVAEFRQSWINDLRNSLNDLQEIAADTELNPRQNPKLYAAVAKIQLLTNPTEVAHQELRAQAANYVTAGFKQENKYNESLIASAETVLKIEWERLKDDLRKRKI